ncbi:ELWxxDGT repeat protein [Corallococcus sp. EGB]|uniref:ELWxxDGT repeat protein n=1 Tax=Corallococcus sp. EGB TaxID=1521117 RepID=UPI001CC045CF|nr:ELWxxDGT repeat protein [Corallococcus sp. EGB]
MATVAEDSREVTAQACPPGVASPVATLQPAGQVDVMTEFTNVQGTLFFVTSTYSTGSVLWRSDGTAAGTVKVKSFPGPPGVYQPQHLVAVGNTLFFQVRTDTTGMELWRSDGTPGGTRLVKDITPGAQGSVLTNATELDGRLVFFRWVPLPGGLAGPELWRSDGTAAGTLRVRTFNGMTGLGNYTMKVDNALLFFFSEDTGTTLWRTDGTLAGTTSVKRLDAGLTYLTEVSRPGEQPVFILEDGPNYEVWKTNGTAAGTLRLDSFGKRVSLLGTLGSHVYLASLDSPATRRLRIDRLSLSGGGKTGITTLPNPYASDERAYPAVRTAVVSGGDLYFEVDIVNDDPVPADVSLWATNGTAAGTRQLFDNPYVEYGYYYPLFATGSGQVLFGGTSQPIGPTFPYFTRGSTATQGRLADVSSPNSFIRVGNRIFFTGIAATGDGQLWSVPATFSCPPGLTEARE